MTDAAREEVDPDPACYFCNIPRDQHPPLSDVKPVHTYITPPRATWSEPATP